MCYPADEAPWMEAMITFVLMAVGLALVVVGVVYRENISQIFCPKDTLPQHLKEVCVFIYPLISHNTHVNNLIVESG